MQIISAARLRSPSLEEVGGSNRSNRCYFTDVYSLQVFLLSTRGAVFFDGGED